MNHSDCLAQEELTEYLEGSLDPPIKTATEAHLVTCNKCRRSLAELMRVMNHDVTPDENIAIAAAGRRWSAGGMGRGIVERPVLSRFGWLLAVAAVLILGLISIPLVLNRNLEPATGGEVVQLLLAQQRPFEAQLSGQPHIPMVRTRGGEQPGVSWDLLDTEMDRLSSSSFELGRFYLIQKDFTRAIPLLENAEKENPGRPECHNDLGVAYLESGDPSSSAMAEQEFRHALGIDARFAPSVFNMAVFLERSGETLRAEAELQRFLNLDPPAAWATEARSKLEGISR
jgi:hypothetical protein